MGIKAYSTNRVYKNVILHEYVESIGYSLFVFIGIGSTVNYQLTRQVADFALHFYQKRHLIKEER